MYNILMVVLILLSILYAIVVGKRNTTTEEKVQEIKQSVFRDDTLDEYYHKKSIKNANCRYEKTKGFSLTHE